MPLKKLRLKTSLDHQGKRLDDVLTQWLSEALKQPVSKGKARKLIIAGAVYLNAKRVRIASKELRSNAWVEVFLDLEKLNSTTRDQDQPFEMTQGHVLFEDEDLIAVNKPPGLPTQPTLDEARENLFLSVKKFLAKREQKSITDIYLGLHHRLDRDTSGVILFTKSKRANPGVAQLFTEHLAQKTYQALCSEEGAEGLQDSWEIRNYLGKDKRAGSKANRYCSVRSGGDFAHTKFRVLERDGNLLRVEAQPLTGRTHQIRVHLSEFGLPILGDSHYGGKSKVGAEEIPRVMLHAVSLSFPHPLSGEKVWIQSPLPEDFVHCFQRKK